MPRHDDPPAAPLSAPRAWLLANPSAGASRGRALATGLRTAVGTLASLGWTVSWHEPESSAHAHALAAKAAAEGVDVVVVAGGDGTINGVVGALVGTETALAVLPTGTANVLAAQLGLLALPSPLQRPDLPAAAAHLAAGIVRPVDTGFVQRPDGERPFLLWAGIGLDAAVTYELEHEGRELKRALGPVAFGAVGLKLAARGGAPAIVDVDGERRRGRLVVGVVCNIPLYAGAIHLAPAARMDDGHLDAALLFGDSVLSAVQAFLGDDVRTAVHHLGTVLTGRPDDDVPTIPVERGWVVARPPLPVHVDGEPYGTTPVRLGVRPTSLRLLVPPTAPASLFAGAAGERADE
jgi:diacylglycerol kinase family enzyme